eukprot:gene13996-19930_t
MSIERLTCHVLTRHQSPPSTTRTAVTKVKAPAKTAGMWMLCQDSPDYQSIENAKVGCFAFEANNPGQTGRCYSGLGPRHSSCCLLSSPLLFFLKDARNALDRVEVGCGGFPTEKNIFSSEDSLSDPLFANGDNVGSMLPFLLNSLRGLGLPHDFDLQSGSPADIATACNVLYELIRQRNTDRSTIEILEGQACKLRSNASTADRERARGLDTLESNKRELGNLEIKVRNMERAHRSELQQLQRDKEAIERKLRSAETRQGQFQAAIRRKDQDLAELTRKLKASMGGNMSSGGVEAGGANSVYVGSAGGGGGVRAAGVEAGRRMSKAVGGNSQVGRGKGPLSREESSEADGQLQEMLEISEVQNAALMAENGSLRRSLEGARQEAARLKERAEVLGFGPMLAPADLRIAGVQEVPPFSNSTSGGSSTCEYMASTLQVVQDRCRRLLSCPLPGDAATKGCGPSCQSHNLAMQLDHARSLIRDQDEAISKAVAALRQAIGAQAQGQMGNSAQMAKVLGLERRVSELMSAASGHAELVADLQNNLQRQAAATKAAAAAAAADAAAYQDQDMACFRTPGSVQSLSLSESRVPELEDEVKVVRKQLDLMRQAVVLTGGKESAEKLSQLVNSASDDAHERLAELKRELAVANHQLERFQLSSEKAQVARPQLNNHFNRVAHGNRISDQAVASFANAPLPCTDSVLQSYAHVPICVVKTSPDKEVSPLELLRNLPISPGLSSSGAPSPML